jgi:adenylate kinase
MHSQIVVITGTPGTGKTTVSGKLAEMLGDASLVKVNDVVKRKHLFSGYAKDGAMLVRMDALAREISQISRASKSRYLILEGHLLCEMKIRGAMAFVMREHLSVLLSRLKRRGYSARKIKDDIVSEAIDYCGALAERNYRRSAEVMCGRGNATAELMARMAKQKTWKKAHGRRFNLLPELQDIMRLPGWRSP